MSVLVVDENMEKKLTAVEFPIAVCGRGGAQLGYFTPIQPAAHYRLTPQVSDAELIRRANDSNCKEYTTDEVLAHLRTL